MGTRTKNQIVLKKQKCGGFLFKIFEPKISIRSTNVALAGNVFGLCVRWGFPALKPIDSTNFNLSTNDYR